LTNPDIILSIVLGSCTDPVFGVVGGRVQQDGIPLDVDHTVAVQCVAAPVVYHITQVEHRSIGLLHSGTYSHFLVELCGRADVQDSAGVISAVSEPAHLVAHQRTKHSIIVRPTAASVISTGIICQTIVQHCRTSDLELTATLLC